jgi:hypothetical protein
VATKTPATAPQVTTVLTVELLSDNSVNLVVSNRHGKWPLRLTADEAGDDNFCWSTLYKAQVGLAVNGRMKGVLLAALTNMLGVSWKGKEQSEAFTQASL